MRLRRWTARVLESVAQTRRVFEAPPRRAAWSPSLCTPPTPPRSLRAAGGGPEGLRCLPERGARSFPPAQCPERASPAQHCPQPHVPPTLAWATSVTHRGLARPPLSAPAARPCRAPRSAPGRPSRIPTGSPRSSPTVQPRSLRLGSYVPLNSRRPPVAAAFPQVPQKVQARGTSMYFHRAAVDAHSDLWETTLSTTGLVLFQVISNYLFFRSHSMLGTNFNKDL